VLSPRHSATGAIVRNDLNVKKPSVTWSLGSLATTLGRRIERLHSTTIGYFITGLLDLVAGLLFFTLTARIIVLALNGGRV